MRIPGLIAFFATALAAQSLDGTWHGTLNTGSQEIPFRFDLAGTGANINGTFFNGDERFTSTSGQLSAATLNLRWEYFAATLEAKVDKDAIDGTYSRARSKPMHFHATRTWMKPVGANPPWIGGLWILENVKSSKGESAWHFVVKQQGGEIAATILRVDGDTGTLSGWYDGAKFILSHFSGQRPDYVEVTPQPDGTLKLIENGKDSATGYRADVAKAKGLPQPSDPTQHTGVKDASEPFHFRFADLNGRMVADNDPRFTGKVVLINISGSWCPNCHDEAPFLVELYKKYRAQGLEIVTLSFEEGDQLKNPTRLHSFIARYGIDYTVLLAGDSSQAAEKLPQTKNWDAWPTTLLIGRVARVREVNTGFPSKASGELYALAKEEITAKVEHLLAESALSLH
ncbi:MAG: TlpA family protein disulfide reductase [Acidobacteriia bacterium]|nr:TlpA family protein disulfide reductase [Terriglobia bacterium]